MMDEIFSRYEIDELFLDAAYDLADAFCRQARQPVPFHSRSGLPSAETTSREPTARGTSLPAGRPSSVGVTSSRVPLSSG
mgnify:CR=1 FL=1